MQALYRMARTVRQTSQLKSIRVLRRGCLAAIAVRRMRRLVGGSLDEMEARYQRRSAAIKLQRAFRALLAFLRAVREHAALCHAELARDPALEASGPMASEEPAQPLAGSSTSSTAAVTPAAVRRGSVGPPAAASRRPSLATPASLRAASASAVPSDSLLSWLSETVQAPIEQQLASMRRQRDELTKARLLRNKRARLSLQLRVQKQLETCRAKQDVYRQAIEGALMAEVPSAEDETGGQLEEKRRVLAALQEALEAMEREAASVDECLVDQDPNLDVEVKRLHSQFARCNGGLIVLSQLYAAVPARPRQRACTSRRPLSSHRPTARSPAPRPSLRHKGCRSALARFL